jgi:hypothetical protein
MKAKMEGPEDIQCQNPSQVDASALRIWEGIGLEWSCRFGLNELDASQK